MSATLPSIKTQNRVLLLAVILGVVAALSEPRVTFAPDAGEQPAFGAAQD